MTIANQIGFGVTLALDLYQTAPKPEVTSLGPSLIDLHIYGVVHEDAADRPS